MIWRQPYFGQALKPGTDAKAYRFYMTAQIQKMMEKTAYSAGKTEKSHLDLPEDEKAGKP